MAGFALRAQKRCKFLFYSYLRPKKNLGNRNKIFFSLDPELGRADNRSMQHKHLRENDEYQHGDVFQVENGHTQMWGYYWLNSEGDWVSSSYTDMQYSSKDAAKRAVSRMIRKYPEAWKDADFVFARLVTV